MKFLWTRVETSREKAEGAWPVWARPEGARRTLGALLRELGLALFLLIAILPSAYAETEVDFASAMAEGRSAEAVGQWGQARAAYGRALALAEQHPGQEVDALIGLAQAERALGEVPASLEHLERARQQLDSGGALKQRGRVEASLGASELAMGRVSAAEAWFEKAKKSAEAQKAFGLTASVENDWGVLEALRGRPEEARIHFEAAAKAAAQADQPLLEARALGNAARSWAEVRPERAAQLRAQAAEQLESQPVSRTQLELWVNLGEQEGNQTPLTGQARLRAARWLYAGLAGAEQSGDDAVAAQALAALSELYASEDRVAEALELVDRALAHARQTSEFDTLYRLEVQRAGLLERAGRPQEAITAYRRAIEALEPLRHRLPWAGELNPSSFEEGIRPVYESLIGLLLDRAAAESAPKARQALLRQARDTLEAFKAAELRDYFEDDCVEALQSRLASIESVSSGAAILYPVSLPDRLVVLTTWPSGEIVQHETPVSQAALSDEVSNFRRRLEQAGTRRYLLQARRLYDWLVRPVAGDLEKRGVETLVFVPSGVLLTIPMAALNDGEAFLVDRYALGLTPGLELTDPGPFNREAPRALLAGLSEAVDGFVPLPNVIEEVDQVHAILGGEVLLNAAFRRQTLREQLAEAPYTVVHLATHAVFSPDDQGAYLLTSDGRLSMEGLATDIGTFRFREQPLELLTLSACETAEGNQRAALGLSGVAVQAGARSALGSLWSVNDPATAQLVSAFYRALLRPGVSRAQALSEAQRELKKDFRYRHPAYWAPMHADTG